MKRKQKNFLFNKFWFIFFRGDYSILVSQSSTSGEADNYWPIYHGIRRSTWRYCLLSGSLIGRGTDSRETTVCHGNHHHRLLHGICTGKLCTMRLVSRVECKRILSASIFNSTLQLFCFHLSIYNEHYPCDSSNRVVKPCLGGQRADLWLVESPSSMSLRFIMMSNISLY